MNLNELYQWIGIASAIFIGLWNFFLYLKKKAKIILTAEILKIDHEKQLNATIHPVNQLIIYITNASVYPMTIRKIEFDYREKDDQTKIAYDNFSHKSRTPLHGKTLLKSEEAILRLSNLDPQEEKVIENLVGITVISTYGHKYQFKTQKLKEVIEALQQLPLPDPDLACLNFNNH